VRGPRAERGQDSILATLSSPRLRCAGDLNGSLGWAIIENAACWRRDRFRPPMRCRPGSLCLMVSEPTKQRHKTIVARSTITARSVGNVGVAAFGAISANAQGHFEPHHRGRVVPAFTAFSRPLEGDDGSGPAVPVDEHMGQGMHLRLTIHDRATPWCLVEISTWEGSRARTISASGLLLPPRRGLPEPASGIFPKKIDIISFWIYNCDGLDALTFATVRGKGRAMEFCFSPQESSRANGTTDCLYLPVIYRRRLAKGAVYAPIASGSSRGLARFMAAPRNRTPAPPLFLARSPLAAI
jgi:hypothetical protein